MFGKAIVRALLAAVVVLTLGRNIEAVVLPLTNPGFETPGSVPSGLPAATLNEWRGDPADSVTTENSIVPADGSRMLQFLESYPTGPIGIDCAIWQILDVSGYQSYIQQGGVNLTGTALFNRIAGDANTDTEFGVRLKAYEGMPSSFHDEIATVVASIFSDSNLATWEPCGVTLPLPTNTQFVSVCIFAQENILNDNTFPEFQGHYADTVTISINTIPEPSTLVLFSIGTISLLAYAWRLRRMVA